MTHLTTIGFDADDTLWQNEQFFRLTEGRFRDLLKEHADPEHLSARLLEAVDAAPHPPAGTFSP